MADLTQHKIYKNNNFEVLTDEGFKKFKGVIVGTNNSKIKINFSNKRQLICTPKHKIIVDSKFNFLYAKDLVVGSKIHNNIVVENIETYEDLDPVYELLEVEDNHRYLTNGILSRQCLILDELAFIDEHLVQDFWKSVYPIISSSKKSKIFVASTPNGSGNLFHNLYTGALETDPEKHNGWRAERVDWWEVPGRDEKWKRNTIRELGSQEYFDQEFGNVFIHTGESVISSVAFNELKSECADPLYVFDDGKYLMWEEPNDESIYAVGVDVSEGVGEAASVIQVLELTDLKNIRQVAIYHDRNINPINFTTKLLEILKHWGSPLALIERNNCGAQVVEQLKYTHCYENIVTYGAKAGNITANRVGISSHSNTKYRGVINMRYWVNELKCVKIRDINTLKELKGFVRYPNSTWAARAGINEWDDRVMSLVWALIILDDELVEKYFEVEEYDDNRRPLRLKSLDYGIKHFVKPDSIYSESSYASEKSMPLPILMQGNNLDESSDINDLESQGWEIL